MSSLHSVPVHVVGNVHTTGGASTLATVMVALAGVLVGGILTYLGNVAVQRRETRGRVGAAGRMLTPELIGKSMGIIALQQSGRWPQVDGFPFLLSNDAWKQVGYDLAQGDKETWMTVASTYIEFDHIGQKAALRAQQPLDNEDRELLGRAQSSATQSIVLLGALSERPRWFDLKGIAKYRQGRKQAIRNVRTERLRQARRLQETYANAQATARDQAAGDTPDR